MKIRTIEELISAYNGKIDLDFSNERATLISVNSHSVIVEGDQMELESLDKFIIQKFGLDFLKSVIYDKIHYNYHFSEYFFKSSDHALEIELCVPKIYTTYTNSYPPNKILKSNSFDDIVEFNPKFNDDAIIF